ncbi:MAG: hypothetical protein ABL931_05425, partial [Usitatibacteraceae bacterium]
MTTTVSLRRKCIPTLISSLLASGAMSLAHGQTPPITPPSGPGATPVAAAAGLPPAARPDAAAPKPFAEIIKDAKRIPGYFTLYQ